MPICFPVLTLNTPIHCDKKLNWRIFCYPPPPFPTKSLDFMLLIDIRNVLQSNEFVWNQSHIPNIMHPVSIHSNKHVLCAILNHYINEIKWILAKVFGTFRDIVISSVIKPRPFWVFWWLRFFSSPHPDQTTGFYT